MKPWIPGQFRHKIAVLIHERIHAHPRAKVQEERPNRTGCHARGANSTPTPPPGHCAALHCGLLQTLRASTRSHGPEHVTNIGVTGCNVHATFTAYHKQVECSQADTRTSWVELTEILASRRVAHDFVGICDGLGDRVVMEAMLVVERDGLNIVIG